MVALRSLESMGLKNGTIARDRRSAATRVQGCSALTKATPSRPTVQANPHHHSPERQPPEPAT